MILKRKRGYLKYANNDFSNKAVAWRLAERWKTFGYVQNCIANEGFDYAFRYYANYEEVKDRRFHSLREKYIAIADELDEYVANKAKLDPEPFVD